MKLLELAVENVRGVPNGVHSFAEANGSHRDVVVLAGDAAGVLLQTIAALVEALRTPVPTAYQLDWWARRRGPEEGRLRACWALSPGEAACAGVTARTSNSEWRFGPRDEFPRELPAEEGRPPRVRADHAQYAYLDANRSAVWMGGPAADPLAEVLAGIAREDIAGTRVCCREGVGIVRWSTPDTIAALNPAIAGVFPALRLERVACARGGVPVVCFRDKVRVELDQLADGERDAIHIVAALHTAMVRDGVVLVDRPELHAPREAHGRWLDWLADLAGTNQLFVAAAEPIGSFVQRV